MISQTIDCGCQSTLPIEQSCQCCECKDIGVSTSKDTETTTEQIMTGEKLPKSIQKDNHISSFDIAGDGPTPSSKKSDGTERAVAVTISGKTYGTYIFHKHLIVVEVLF